VVLCLNVGELVKKRAIAGDDVPLVSRELLNHGYRLSNTGASLEQTASVRSTETDTNLPAGGNGICDLTVTVLILFLCCKDMAG